MTDRLRKLLAERGVLIADGATGTNYFDMGLASGEPPEAWLLDHPEKVADLHRALRRGRLRHHPHQQLRRDQLPA